MQWQGGREGGNIEDRRGMGGAIGGLGAGGAIIALLGYFLFGINPQETLDAVSSAGPAAQVQQQEGARGAPSDEAGRFVDVISTSVDDVWTQIFRQQGKAYRPPEGVVLYDQATGTGCGLGQSAMGPFYCPQDHKVYLDLSFWDELGTRFGATGEAARAYVIAHEMGHHVQSLTGAASKAERMGAQGAQSGSVRLELQADCYAGVWVAHAAEMSGGKVRLDPKDVEDGLRAAAAVGDDALQRAARGRVSPDSFTHGTSEQRMRWFRAGVQGGDPASCDTFGARSL